jgi:hypothetical protein
MAKRNRVACLTPAPPKPRMYFRSKRVYEQSVSHNFAHCRSLSGELDKHSTNPVRKKICNFTALRWAILRHLPSLGSSSINLMAI